MHENLLEVFADELPARSRLGATTCAIGCHIITVANDILKKLSLVDRDLADYSLDTVKMFFEHRCKAGFTL